MRFRLFACLILALAACASVTPEVTPKATSEAQPVERVEPEAKNMVEDPDAGNGEAAVLYAQGERALFRLGEVPKGTYELSLRARGEAYRGPPVMRLFLKGQPVGEDHAAEQDYSVQRFGEASLEPGDTLEVEFTNDLYENVDRDRNLIVDHLVLNAVGEKLEGSKPKKPGQATLLPLEVIGPDGYTEEVPLNLSSEEAEDADTLYLQCHRCGYSSTGKRSGQAKASVRLNGGDWLDLTDSAVDMNEQDRAYGGFEGGHFTTRFTVNMDGFQEGENTLELRFNGTDNLTSGYRIIDMNVMQGDAPLLPEDLFAEDDPMTWEPPLDNESDVQAGETLWEEAVLEDFPGGPEIKATCSGCHHQDARDLQLYAFSNRSITERSKFHGLTEKEGEQIASYIRNLKDEGVEPYGRPWDPPYQPGSGLDDRPVEQWAAGAGLDAVLEEDADMERYLFPKGTSASAVRKVVDTSSTLNLRELPVAFQLPDWMAWLPARHPVDAFDNYKGSQLESRYRELEDGDPSTKLSEFNRAAEQFLSQGAKTYFIRGQKPSAAVRFPWRIATGKTVNAISSDISREEAKRALAQWVAVKNWEFMQAEGREANVPQSLPKPEVRGWLGDTYNVWPNAPHITADNLENFEGMSFVAGKHQSVAWYQLQMTLNPGFGTINRVYPVDWEYQQRHIFDLSKASGQQLPLHLYQTALKAYQTLDNGKMPGPNSWQTRITHPHILLSDYYYDDDSMFKVLNSDLRVTVTEAMLEEWLDVVNGFNISEWERMPANAVGKPLFKNWWRLEPTTHIPKERNAFGYLEHADNLFTAIPKFEQMGVRQSTLDGLADFGEKAWPKGDWGGLTPSE